MRQMFEVRPGHWLVRCKACPPDRHYFDTAAECHAWWREHIQSDDHHYWTRPVPDADKEKAERFAASFGIDPSSRWVRRFAREISELETAREVELQRWLNSPERRELDERIARLSAEGKIARE